MAELYHQKYPNKKTNNSKSKKSDKKSKSSKKGEVEVVEAAEIELTNQEIIKKPKGNPM